MNLTSILILFNTFISTGIAVTAFSLVLYVLRYNWTSPVARPFMLILASTMIVYTGDALLPRVTTSDAAEGWLRFEWIGIALAPAAYLHFADEVLRTTNALSLRRRRGVYLGYAYAIVFIVAALSTDLVVFSEIDLTIVPRLSSGELFPWYIAFFLVSVGFGFRNIVIARQRCLTPTSQRRMTYLLLSSTAPALGVFPFLIIIAHNAGPISTWLLLLLILGNTAIGVMLVVMAYSVAFFGVLAPDRVVKRRLVRFLMRGPITAALVVTTMLTATRLESLLDLPSETLMIVGVLITVVFVAVLRGSVQPIIDLLLFRQDRDELAYIEQLGERLLTSTDVQQFMENVLTSVIDLMRVSTAFIASRSADDRWEMLALIGSIPPMDEVFAELRSGMQEPERGNGAYRANGYLVWPLYSRANGELLGALSMLAGAETLDPIEEESERLDELIQKAAIALDDRRLQAEVFAAVEQILPEIDVIQRQRGAQRYVDSPPQQGLEATLAADPEFIANVKSALSHYWGGPKLTASPLLRMTIVNRAMSQTEGDASKALRVVLQDAIEQLRPNGQRSMTAAEWVLYNILEMRFVQGKRVREIAMKLAMSESDLYRKQRVAVEAVARCMAQMEVHALNGTGGELPAPPSA